ncbi:hypothetical protein [Candidatus Poriferisodalis sp.]|uniref:hypothetical protein n=1 Tax=Candidatus Poriferisodalis sp. TaxID=3101277 RepID=UPI003B02BE61
MTNAASELLPAQLATLDVIRVPVELRPAYAHSFATDLRIEIEAALAEHAEAAREIDSRGMWVSKRTLAGVFGCEARFLADERTPFEWSVPTARGTVLHKAVELCAYAPSRREGRPMAPDEAVDAARRNLACEDGLGDFLAAASDSECAELKSNCVALLTRFSETFPPMLRAWRPAVEVRARQRLCGGAIVLSGKYDLTLGSPTPLAGHNMAGGGSAGGAVPTAAEIEPEGRVRAGKVIIDLKTGARAGTDPEDLRFYALIETLTVGVPPLGIGSFYVAEGRIEHEAVTVDVLHGAVRRTVDGIGRLIALRAGKHEPQRHPGPPCRWCPISADCEPGQRWLSELDR